MENQIVNTTVENELDDSELKDKSLFYKVINGLCSFFLIMQVAVVTIVVVGRFVFSKTPGWGEELALLCMVWFSLLSISLGIVDSRHLKMTILEMYAHRYINNYVKVFSYFVFFSISIFMTIEGTKLSILTSTSMMPGLHLPGAFLYSAVPVSGFIMFIALVGKLLRREAL